MAEEPEINKEVIRETKDGVDICEATDMKEQEKMDKIIKFIKAAERKYKNLTERAKYMQNELHKTFKDKWCVCIFPKDNGVAFTYYDKGYLLKANYKDYHYKIYRHGKDDQYRPKKKKTEEEQKNKEEQMPNFEDENDKLLQEKIVEDGEGNKVEQTEENKPEENKVEQTEENKPEETEENKPADTVENIGFDDEQNVKESKQKDDLHSAINPIQESEENANEKLPQESLGDFGLKESSVLASKVDDKKESGIQDSVNASAKELGESKAPNEEESKIEESKVEDEEEKNPEAPKENPAFLDEEVPEAKDEGAEGAKEEEVKAEEAKAEESPDYEL
ncbi:MAG: hypothetical protein MJ252_24040 [archaeon]|nr:hypothetical protein [archaeon]